MGESGVGAYGVGVSMYSDASHPYMMRRVYPSGDAAGWYCAKYYAPNDYTTGYKVDLSDLETFKPTFAIRY